jgi:glycosyltransferase involved in cell wall biosynthesis
VTSSPEAGFPLVSIVIVAHNNWPDLEVAIESALNQSHRNTEVLVIDNGSTDETPSEVERLYASSVRYIRQPNLHGSGGYNKGIAESRGDFIQLLDGDDFLAPNKIEKQLRVFRESPEVDIVYGDTRQIQGGTGRPAWYDWETTEHADMLATLIDPPQESDGLLPHSVLFRREACERIGPWDEDILSADPDYWLRAAWGGCVFRYCRGSWCFHRRRATSVSGNSRAMVDRMEQTYEKAATYIDREPYRSAVLARLARLRVGRAVSDERLTRAESVARLKSARRIAPQVVSRAAYALAYAVVLIPGARTIARLNTLTGLRRRMGRYFGLLPRRQTGW